MAEINESLIETVSLKRVDEATAEITLRDLNNLMENEKTYRDPDLTLRDLAEKIEITPHNLSELLNVCLNQNFYTFVNNYRVEEVIKALENRKIDENILTIAYEAGFKSKTSFNRTFKKVTGLTPSGYRKRL